MRLQAYLKLKELSPEEFAERITARGVRSSPHGVRKWIAGERTPRKRAMQAIIEETGGAVMSADFFDVPKKAA